MVEEAAAAPAVDEKPVASVTPDAGTEKPAGANGAGLGAEAAKGDNAPVERSLWPDDWRERWAGKGDKDGKELARLRRFQSPDNVYNSLRSIENKVHTGYYQPVLGEGATEEQVAEYRKSNGIPEEVTPEGYGVKWPDGYEATETDKADLSAFLGEMHGGHIPASVVQKVWQSYVGMQAKASEELQVAAAQITDENKAEVRSKYMNDKGRFDRVRFDRDTRLGNAFLAEHLGEERSQQITALTLSNGTKLGDHPLFYELFTAAALKVADDDSIMNAENSAAGGGSFDEQYRAALSLADTDPRTYHSAEHQAKLMRMASAKSARASKQAA